MSEGVGEGAGEGTCAGAGECKGKAGWAQAKVQTANDGSGECAD